MDAEGWAAPLPPALLLLPLLWGSAAGPAAADALCGICWGRDIARIMLIPSVPSGYTMARVQGCEGLGGWEHIGSERVRCGVTLRGETAAVLVSHLLPTALVFLHPDTVAQLHPGGALRVMQPPPGSACRHGITGQVRPHEQGLIVDAC